MRTIPTLIEIANTAQRNVSRNAQLYIPEVLAATGQAKADRPEFDIAEDAYVGTSGDGRPTESLLYGSLTKTKEAIGNGALYVDALAQGGQYLTTALGTLLSDTQRGMEGFETYSRPIGGYVRMLTPPSCGRCVILAGKWFRKNTGFQRHPGCDCVHIPASEDIGGHMTTDPTAYLRSLAEDELAEALGSKANAQTWLEFGQDSPQQTLNQLVNAYRKGGGIQTAQVYGKNVKYVTEGTTRRGVAYFQMSRVRALSTQGEVKDGRYRRLVAPRLMPESIFQIATNREHALRLLTDHGWLGIR